MVEGGAKRRQALFCGPGMRWSRTGAEHLPPIRTAILSGRFDARWRAVQNAPSRETRPIKNTQLTPHCFGHIMYNHRSKLTLVIS
jgi:hypothetical protein